MHLGKIAASFAGGGTGRAYRTKERWVPRLRWEAEQSMQMKMPRGIEAQVGFFASQSKQVCKEKQHARSD